MLNETDLITRTLNRIRHIHPDTVRDDALQALEAVLLERMGGQPGQDSAAQEALRAEVRAAMRAPANNLAHLLGTSTETVRRVLCDFRT